MKLRCSRSVKIMYWRRQIPIIKCKVLKKEKNQEIITMGKSKIKNPM